MATLQEKAAKLQAMADAKFSPEQQALLLAARTELNRVMNSYGMYGLIAMTLVAAEAMDPRHEGGFSVEVRIFACMVS